MERNPLAASSRPAGRMYGPFNSRDYPNVPEPSMKYAVEEYAFIQGIIAEEKRKQYLIIAGAVVLAAGGAAGTAAMSVITFGVGALTAIPYAALAAEMAVVTKIGLEVIKELDALEKGGLVTKMKIGLHDFNNRSHADTIGQGLNFKHLRSHITGLGSRVKTEIRTLKPAAQRALDQAMQDQATRDRATQLEHNPALADSVVASLARNQVGGGRSLGEIAGVGRAAPTEEAKREATSNLVGILSRSGGAVVSALHGQASVPSIGSSDSTNTACDIMKDAAEKKAEQIRRNIATLGGGSVSHGLPEPPAPPAPMSAAESRSTFSPLHSRNSSS